MFKIYSASAGSGKTYTLTKEYLKLALGEGQPVLRPGTFRGTYFRNILAITFTNAAANEMKERILRELTTISQLKLADYESFTALKADKNTRFLLDLTGEFALGVTDASVLLERVTEVQKRAKRLFQAILHRYSDFAVNTIDSFTQRLVMAFTDELGLPYSFDVEMETAQVLEVAVDNLIERVGTGEMADITAVMHELFAESAQEGHSWNMIAGTLQDFGKVLTSDQHYAAVERIANLTPAQIRAIRQRLVAFRADYEQRIRAHGQTAWNLITGAGLGEKDFHQSSKGIGVFFKEVAEGKTDKEPNSYHLAAVNDQYWYNAKTTKLATQAAIDAITNGLCECFAAIVDERETNGKLLALNKAIDPNLQKMALLKQIRDEFEALLRKDNRVHISEFNKRIKAIVESEPVPFLFERLGSKYNHILIDEFQDTSQLQFANLLPLIENALGSNHVNLVVGDGKQAIYRWRGGDMDQIAALHRNQLTDLQRIHGPETWTAERIDALGAHISPAVLDYNYRSAKPIVQFNNEFFAFVADRYTPENGRIGEVYDAGGIFRQKPAETASDQGHIQFDFIGKDDVPTGSSLDNEIVQRTVRYVQQARAGGYRYGDMAVLTRSRKDAQLVANELNRLLIPLISADSLSLRFSEPVRFLIALLTMINRPGQRTLHYEMLYLYHSVVHNRVPDDAQTERLRAVADTTDDQPVFDYLAQDGFPLQPTELAQLGVYELAEKLTHGFRLFDRPHDQPFLFRFFDEILAFCGRQSGHLADFLHHWDLVSEKVSVSEGLTSDAITIQTIHKSKGLEYPVVIVPFADWSVKPMQRATMWLDLESIDSDLFSTQQPDGSSTRLLHAEVTLKKDLTGTPDGVMAQYEAEMSRHFIETMNLLYVAFTRPTDRLYVIAERKKFEQKDPQATVAYWLHSFLRDSPQAETAGCRWCDGQQTYILTGSTNRPALRRAPKTTAPESIDVQPFSAGSRGQQMQLRRMAERVFDTLTFEQHRERDRKLCAALSLIKGHDCIDKTLARLVREGVIRAVEQADLRVGLADIVTHPDLTDAFGYDRRIDTDRRILANKQAQGAPHRVVHRPDGGVVLVQYAGQHDEAETYLGTFIDLYKAMGYASVEGRIVWLTNVPTVQRV